MTKADEQALKQGCQLLKERTIEPNLSIVLCFNQHAVQPYVTWLFNEQSNGFCWGHYFSDRSSAINDYFARKQ